MKTAFLSCILILFTGCSLNTPKEVKIAQDLVNHFQCNNIDNEQLTHNPITGFQQRTLSVSKDRAQQYIDLYLSGDATLDMPLDDLVELQYGTFKSACEFLGGVTLALDQPIDPET